MGKTSPTQVLWSLMLADDGPSTTTQTHAAEYWYRRLRSRVVAKGNSFSGTYVFQSDSETAIAIGRTAVQDGGATRLQSRVTRSSVVPNAEQTVAGPRPTF